jgi:flagellar protein FlaG
MDISSIGNTPPSNLPRPEGATPVVQKAAVQAQTADAVQQAASTQGAQLQKALEDINKAIQMQEQGIEFSVDPESDRTIVKVVDKNTGSLLRQIPSEEALDIAKALDRAQGLLIHQKA